MASFTKVNDFVVNLANAMDMDADTFKVALCNTDPTSGTNVTTDGNGILANISEISYTNLSARTLQMLPVPKQVVLTSYQRMIWY